MSTKKNILTLPEIDCYKKYLELLQKFGGLQNVNVANSEWLYMLELETRQSLAIEGYFSSASDLKAVLNGRKSWPEIENYYRIASTIYDQALQNYRENELILSAGLVRHIHSELFRGLKEQRGLYRKGKILINGARISPPEFDIEFYIHIWIKITLELLKSESLVKALAFSHALFESIYPFEDGNGRIGRILLNYLAISNGLPPFIIKGFELKEREMYYQALEQADQGLKPFPKAEKKVLLTALQAGNVQPLIQLLCQAIIPQFERVIVAIFEKDEDLFDFKGLSLQLNVKEVTLRQWLRRGKLIAIKRNGKLYSSSKLLLD